MSKQVDFQEQYSQLQGEVEATENLVIFYFKFYCKLNFIKQYTFFLILCTSHNLIESCADFDMPPSIMPMKTANIIWKVYAKRCQKL